MLEAYILQLVGFYPLLEIVPNTLMSPVRYWQTIDRNFTILRERLEKPSLLPFYFSYIALNGSKKLSYQKKKVFVLLNGKFFFGKILI